jgi:hypothetical protein
LNGIYYCMPLQVGGRPPGLPLRMHKNGQPGTAAAQEISPDLFSGFGVHRFILNKL